MKGLYGTPRDRISGAASLVGSISINGLCKKTRCPTILDSIISWSKFYVKWC